MSSRELAGRDGRRGGRVRPPRRARARAGRRRSWRPTAASSPAMLKLLLERGIADHADAGDRVRARDPRGHRLAHLLVDHPPRHRGAGRLRARSARTRSCSPATCAGRCSREQRELLRAARSPRAPSARSRDCAWSPPPRRPTLRRGRVDAGLADGRRRPTGTRCSCASRWRAGCWWSARSRTPALVGRRGARRRSVAAGTRRPPPRSCARRTRRACWSGSLAEAERVAQEPPLRAAT